MEHPPRLFVLDTVMVDVMMKVAALPVLGSDIRASTHLITTGGGFNVMSAAARHGMTAVYAGQLGTGPTSAIALASLRREGIDVPVGVDPDVDLGFCLVLVDDNGERTFVTSTGAELCLTLADLDSIRVDSGDYVFLSGYNLVYPEIGASVTKWIEGLDSGVIVAFDPGPRFADIPQELWRRSLARTDWLFCNTAEGLSLSAESSLDTGMGILLAMTGRGGVIVHDGAQGCRVATRKIGPTRVAGFSVDVVDTNGAGDTHNGVVLAELARGTFVLDAARRANAAAALAVGRLGPATCPTRDEVSAWMAL